MREASGTNNTWQMNHHESHHKIKVERKVVNKVKLMLLREQSSQVCQVRVDLFGDCDDCDQKAMDFMKDLGTKYANGDIQKDAS